MIRSFEFSNFYSFADPAVVSFDVGQQPTKSGYDLTYCDGSRGNRVLGLVGANGSGKSQLLRVLAFLAWFVRDSFQTLEPEKPIPYQAHRRFASKPSDFRLLFDMEGEEYRYELTLHEGTVAKEALYLRTSSKFSYVFIRERLEAGGYAFKQQGFGLNKHAVRNNVSVIAAAHMQDSALAARLVRYFKQFTSNLNMLGRAHLNPTQLAESARFFRSEPTLHDEATALLRRFDLGLDDVTIRDMEGVLDTGEKNTIPLPFGQHGTGTDGFELSFFEESSGTQALYVLLQRLLLVLKNGGVAVIDELDSDLHAHMLEPLLDLFRFEHTNPHQAQLLFSCHSPEILNLLSKHQVCLVQKEAHCSDVWRLDEVVGLRADDNLYAKYMSGALGGVADFV